MTITRPTLSPEQRAMVFEAIEDAIMAVDLAAHAILENHSVGLSLDPATMDDKDRKDYEHLIALARRARCALTLLKIGT